MKKFITAGILSVSLLASIVANASSKVNVTVSPTKQLSISLTEVTQGEVLSISNNNKEVIFTDVLDVADSFTENVNLSTFEQGVYYITLKTENTTKITPIIVSPKLSKIIEGETKTYSTPVFNLENGIVSLDLDNPSNNDVFIIAYAKGSGTALYETKLSKENISKTYSLNLAPGTEYNFYVSQGDYSYTKTFIY